MSAFPVYFHQYPPQLAPTPPPTHPRVGWSDVGRQRRRIPVEQLREILKAQGSPWADELADTYQVAEKRLASPKSKKHAEVLEEVIEHVARKVSQSAATAVDWGPLIESVRASETAKRTTAALKHAEAALSRLRAEAEDDDEEAIILMMMDL